MAEKSSTYVLRGTLHWAKVLGKPRMNEYSGQNEWSCDLTPSDARAPALLGIADKLRTPKPTDERKEPFITFRQRELRPDGSKNDPIRVVNAAGETWDDRTLIGNGSIADVKFQVKDYGKGKPKGVYIRAIRVLELVPYESQEFAPLDEDDEYFAEPEESEACNSDNSDNSDDEII